MADRDVLQRRVAVSEATRHAVHRQFGEAALCAGNGDDVCVALEIVERLRGHQVSGVDLAALQRGDHRVAVTEHSEDDLVDGGLALPVVRVGHHRPLLVGLAFLERERAGADAIERVVGRDVVDRAGVRLPDVPRQDVHIHGRQLGVRHGRHDGERDVVDGGGRQVGGGGEVVGPLLVARGVDRPCNVVGGQRLTVAPLQPGAQVVGEGEAVVAGLPLLGEPGDGREVVGSFVGERRVLQVPQFVRGHRVAHRRVGAVDILQEPHRQRHRVSRRRRRRRRNNRGTQCHRRQCSSQEPTNHRCSPHDMFSPRAGRNAAPSFSQCWHSCKVRRAGRVQRRPSRHQVPIEEPLKTPVEVEEGFRAQQAVPLGGVGDVLELLAFSP